ncbi:MAG TPA: hypothetical protein VFF67_09405 [Thermoplasmata archaeon]|nr:hypothetical protein [Thermoplasmata archaeon]
MSNRAALTHSLEVLLGSIFVVALLLVPASLSSWRSDSSVLTEARSSVCAKPASIDIPLTAPNGTSLAKSILTVKIELQISNYSAVMGSVRINAPSLFATFPTASGGKVEVYTPPRSAVLSNGTWSTPPFAQTSKALSSTSRWAPNGTAYLSSELLAVMATVTNYHALNLSVRWMWSLSQSSGLRLSAWSGWSLVRGCPSSFEPAPFVSLVSTSPTSLAPGSNFTVSLRGFTSQQSFTLKLENSTSGRTYHVFSSTCSVGNATPCNLSISMVNASGQGIAAGSYLVHVHNAIGSLDFSISVRVR